MSVNSDDARLWAWAEEWRRTTFLDLQARVNAMVAAGDSAVGVRKLRQDMDDFFSMCDALFGPPQPEQTTFQRLSERCDRRTWEVDGADDPEYGWLSHDTVARIRGWIAELREAAGREDEATFKKVEERIRLTLQQEARRWRMTHE
jgi:hypothetical protein